MSGPGPHPLRPENYLSPHATEGVTAFCVLHSSNTHLYGYFSRPILPRLRELSDEFLSVVISALFQWTRQLSPFPLPRMDTVLPLCLAATMALVCGTALLLYKRWSAVVNERDRLRIMVNHAPIGIALFDLDRKVIQCNPAFREIYGWDEGEIVGKVPPLPESQRDMWGELRDRLRNGHSFVNVETVRATMDGKQFYARISGSPIVDAHGVPIGLVGFIAKSEDGAISDELTIRGLESLVQSSQDFMAVSNSRLETVFLNDAGREIVGLEESTGRPLGPIEMLFAEEDRPRVQEILRLLPLQHVGATTETLRLRHVSSEEIIPASVSFFGITDPLTGEPSLLGCIARVLSKPD